MKTLISILVLCVLFMASSVGFAQEGVLECGDILEVESTEESQDHFHEIEMSPGDVLFVRGGALGDYMSIMIRIYKGSELIAGCSPQSFCQWKSETEVRTGVLSASGAYRIKFMTYDGPGLFTISVGCIPRNGTPINPGDNMEVSPVSTSEGETTLGQSIVGFPGVPALSFAQGIPLPILLGQTETDRLGSELILYTYDADENETRTLSVSRVSGDISIGVTVINRDTNEIVFLGGMPWSSYLTAELTFPSRGTYAIGLFRLNTAERVETSGAVQVKIE